MRIFRRLAIMLLVTYAELAAAENITSQTLPKGHVIPEFTISPDRKYGVVTPMKEAAIADQLDEPRNSVVDLRTSGVIGTIKGNAGFDYHMNHIETKIPRWSSDSSLLLWEVSGKWMPHTLVLLQIENGKFKWQTDILKSAQAEILARTRKAAPEKYAKAKKKNAGSGSAYPEGFTVDVAVDVKDSQPIALPLRFKAALTDNPKSIEGSGDLRTHMEGTIDKSGKFIVTNFAFGDTDWASFH